jgi:hypothetical protein
MSVRVMGIAIVCAAAALGGPLRAGAEDLSALARAASAETMMRRQPAPVAPRTTPLLRRQRRGTISLGAQIGYGVVRGSSELNDHFDRGVVYGFRFRYIVSRRAALGFSFDNQHYGPRAGLPLSTDPFAAKDSTVAVTTVGTEMIVFFHRERETNPYLLGGLGFASPSVIYETKESRRVDEGPFLVVGAGLERFFRPHASFDFTLRGYAEVGNSELSVFSQLTAGIHLYPGD